MSKIRIKNFGPIKDGYQENDGWIDIKKVTMFIGNQGTGKSTVAKLISTFIWIEKALTRGDFNKEYFERKDVFRSRLQYHKIEEYFDSIDLNGKVIPYGDDHAELEYIGQSYSIKYYKRHLKIEENRKERYPLPQIMYVPSERNFLSTVDDLKSQRLFSEPLKELLTELQHAKRAIDGTLKLPINDVNLEYNNFEDVTYIIGKGYKINLTKSSSGFQSLVPLYLVSWYLARFVRYQSEGNAEPMSSDELERFRQSVAEVYSNTLFTEEQRRAALSVITNKYNKTAFINIVEEPEQNLFPESQWEMLKSLLALNNLNDGNKLIMTTHSPYIINYFTLFVKAAQLLPKIEDSKNKPQLMDDLESIVPLNTVVNSTDLAIYELDDHGNIIKLGDYYGLPSDDNYLNVGLGKSNEMFSRLLDIEDSCQ